MLWHLYFAKAQQPLQKRAWEVCKSQKEGQGPVKLSCSRLNIIMVIMKATAVTCTGPIQNWTCHQADMDAGVAHGAHFLSLNYWLLMDSERGKIIIFTCVLSEEPNRLQWIAQNLWSDGQSWLHGAGHMAWELTELAALPEDPHSIPSTHMQLIIIYTPMPGDLTSSCSFLGYQAYTWFTNIHTTKTTMHKNNKQTSWITKQNDYRHGYGFGVCVCMNLLKNKFSYQ